MFGSMRTVFASRWKALWWAVGVMLTAYCSIPAPDEAPGTQVAMQQKHINPWAKGYKPTEAPPPQKDAIEELREAVEQAQAPPPEHPVNPWAKKPA